MSKVIQVDSDLPMKIADVFQGVDDALEVLEGAFALTDLVRAGQDEDDDEDGDARDTALVASVERDRKISEGAGRPGEYRPGAGTAT